MSGARMKYERSRLSQPWRLTRCTPAFPSDHVGTDVFVRSPERSSACSFSSSAVVAILFKVAYPQTFSRAGGSPRHTYLDADAEHSHRYSRDVNRTGNDDQAARSGKLP